MEEILSQNARAYASCHQPTRRIKDSSERRRAASNRSIGWRREAVSKEEFSEQNARAQDHQYHGGRADSFRHGLAFPRVLPLSQQVRNRVHVPLKGLHALILFLDHLS